MQNTIKEALPQGTLLKGKYTYDLSVNTPVLKRGKVKPVERPPVDDRDACPLRSSVPMKQEK